MNHQLYPGRASNRLEAHQLKLQNQQDLESAADSRFRFDEIASKSSHLEEPTRERKPIGGALADTTAPIESEPLLRILGQALADKRDTATTKACDAVYIHYELGNANFELLKPHQVCKIAQIFTKNGLELVHSLSH